MIVLAASEEAAAAAAAAAVAVAAKFAPAGRRSDDLVRRAGEQIETGAEFLT